MCAPYDIIINILHRYAACGDTTQPCNKVFSLTAENEFNKIVTLENLLSVIDRDACLSRQYARK